MTKIPFVDLKAQYNNLQHEILQEINKVLEGMQLFLGQNVKSFEEEFASYCEAEYAVGVGSGTDALALALIASGISRGDEVITVSHTFFATAEAIITAGGTPVFVDIKPDTYTIDPSLIENKITDRTKAIIPVHLYGQPCDMDPILDIAKRYKLAVIEDACQAHGARYKKKRVGAIGDAGCFSFYFSKNLGAYGEAGAVVTNNKDIAERVRLLRNHGQESKYSHVLCGYNSRLDELQAAILRIKLRHLDKWNERRQEIALLYNRLLTGTNIILPVTADYAEHVFHLYVIQNEERDLLRNKLSERQIESGIHYPVPVHLQKAFKDTSHNLPFTEAIASKIISLPIYPEMTDEIASLVANNVKEFFQHYTKAI